MAVPVIIPQEGGVKSAVLCGWKVKKGGQVKQGDVLCSVETDKTAMDIMSPADGVVLELYYAEGEEAPTAVPIALIGAAGTAVGQPMAVSEYKNNVPDRQIPAPAAQQVPDSISAKLVAGFQANPLYKQGSVSAIASPRAKALIREKNLDITGIRGTGVDGSIICADLEDLSSGGAAALACQVITLHALADAAGFFRLRAMAEKAKEVDQDKLKVLLTTAAKKLSPAFPGFGVPGVDFKIVDLTAYSAVFDAAAALDKGETAKLYALYALDGYVKLILMYGASAGDEVYGAEFLQRYSEFLRDFELMLLL